MNELKVTVYKWCRYGVFCFLIDRNMPTSILCGLSRKVCHTTISPVCKCTLCCLMPRLYHRNCTVWISVRVVTSSTINLDLLMISTIFLQTVQLEVVFNSMDTQDIIGCVDVSLISARVYVLYTCLLGFLALISFIGNEMDLPIVLSGAFLALNLNFDELIYLSLECALHCG